MAEVIDCWAPWRALADAPVVPTKAHLKSTKLFLGSRYGSVGDAREIFQGDGFGNQCVAVAINGDIAARLTHAVNSHDAMLAALREQWRVLNANPKPPDAEMVAAARGVEAAIAKAEAALSEQETPR